MSPAGNNHRNQTPAASSQGRHFTAPQASYNQSTRAMPALSHDIATEDETLFSLGLDQVGGSADTKPSANNQVIDLSAAEDPVWGYDSWNKYETEPIAAVPQPEPVVNPIAAAVPAVPAASVAPVAPTANERTHTDPFEYADPYGYTDPYGGDYPNTSTASYADSYADPYGAAETYADPYAAPASAPAPLTHSSYLDEGPLADDYTSVAPSTYAQEPPVKAPRISEFSPVKRTLFFIAVVALLACIVWESLYLFRPSVGSDAQQAESSQDANLKNNEVDGDPNTLESDS